MIPFCGIPDRRSWGFLALTTIFYYGYLWLLHSATGSGTSVTPTLCFRERRRSSWRSVRLSSAAIAFTLRRGQLFDVVRRESLKVGAIGRCAAIAYTLSINASTYAPIAGVAALRQTSVVIASLFGTFLLGERPSRPRVAAACVIAVGSVLVAAQRVG